MLAAAIPRVLGALLDGMVHGVAELPNVKAVRLPRMADFIVWTRACEGAYWRQGDIQEAFDANMRDAIDAVLEGDYVAIALNNWLAANGARAHGKARAKPCTPRSPCSLRSSPTASGAGPRTARRCRTI